MKTRWLVVRKYLDKLMFCSDESDGKDCTSFNLSNLLQYLNTNMAEREHTYLLCLHKTTNEPQKKFQ